MSFRTPAPPINGRLIFGLGDNGSLRWFVETAGAMWGGAPLQVLRKFDALAEAQAEDLRLGPIADAVDEHGT
jgi:hypothetical protein